MCRRGFSDMQDVLRSTQAENIHLYIVWLPILRTDDRDSAIERTKEFADPRVTYYWDDASLTGKAWQRVLNLEGAAWDVYFLYPAQSGNWSEKPDAPPFWMHQLREVKHAPFLNKDEFKLKALRLLKQE